MSTTNRSERWQRRLDAIVRLLSPTWALERAKARRHLAVLERQPSERQPAGWAPRRRPTTRTTHDGDVYADLQAQRTGGHRLPWLRR